MAAVQIPGPVTFSYHIPPLHRVRMLGLTISTGEVAKVLNKSTRWVRENRHLFEVDETKRNYRFEMASVLEYHFREELGGKI